MKTSPPASLPRLAILAGSIAALLGGHTAQAANTIYTETSTSGNFSAATWSQTGTASGHTVPTTTDAGNVIRTTTTDGTLILDVPITIGGYILNNGQVNFTLGASGTTALTLDGTGVTTASGAFVAGEAFLRGNQANNTKDILTINPRVIMATNVGLGGSQNDNSVVVGGAITNGTASTLTLTTRNAGTTNVATGNVRVNGSIGANKADGTGGITIQNSNTSVGSTVLAGAIGGTTTAGNATDGAAITIANTAAGTGDFTISGPLGASVSSVTQNSTTSSLILSGTNTNYSGTISVAAGNTIKLGSATALGGNGTTTGTGGSLSFGAGSFLDASAATVLTTTNSINLAGQLTFNGTNALTFSAGQALNGAAGSLVKLGAAALTLQGNNTYQGATTIGTAGSVASAGTFTVSGTAGSIGLSSSVSVIGNGSALTLDNTLGVLNTRLGANTPVTLSNGANFNLIGNGATASVAEQMGALGFAGSANSTGSTVTISGTGAGQSVALNAASIARTNLATGLVRGTNLGTANAAGTTSISLTSTAGLGLVGGATPGTKNLAVVPWLLADTSSAGTGSGFATYDTVTNSLRPIVALTESDNYSSTANVTQTAGNNVTISGGTTTLNGTTNSINSLFYTAGGGLAGTSGPLTINSGAIGSAAAGAFTLGGGFSVINLDNGEGIVNGGGVLTISTPIDVTQGGSHLSTGGLTKGGSGTLVLAATSLYTGATNVSQGILQIGNGSGGNLAAGSGPITLLSGTTLAISMADTATLANSIVNNGTISKTAGTTTNTLSGSISGSGVVTQNIAGGTLVLANANSYTGATTVTAGNLLTTAVNALSGATSLTVAAGATATLSKANNFSGATNVTGTLQLQDAGAIASSPLTIASGATLQLRADSDTAFTSSGTISATGGTIILNADQLTGAGTGRTLTLVGPMNVSTGITASGGHGYTVALGALNQTVSNDTNWTSSTSGVTLQIGSFTGTTGNNRNATFSGPGNFAVTGAFSAGNGKNINLAFNQTGTVTLFGANQISRFSAADPSSPVSFDGGTVILNNATPFDTNTAAVNFLGNSNGSAAATLLLGGTDAAGLTGGVTMSRTLTVRDTTSGLLTLGGQNTSGTNTYNGAITLGSTANTGKSVKLQSAAGGTVNFSGGFLVNGTGATTPGGLNVGDATHTGTVQLSGTNTYIGATTVNGGTLQLGSGGSLAGTAVTVASGTLLAAGNYTIGSSGSGSVSLAAGTGALSLVDNGINTLTINNSIAGATALTLGGGNALTFETNATAADQIVLGAGLKLNATGSNSVNIAGLARPAANQTLPLITLPGGFAAGDFTSFVLGTVTGAPGVAYSLANNGSTVLQLTETLTQPTVNGSLYFTGNIDNNWYSGTATTSNFSTDSAGTIDAQQTPGSTTDLHFYATNANTANLNTTIGSVSTTIRTLTVDGTSLNSPSTPVSIGGTGTLTITPAASTAGITVGAGGTLTITTPLVIGAAQTWTNNSANPLTVSGSVSGNAGLTIAGTGTTILSGANTATGATAITSGTLLLQNTNKSPSYVISSGAVLEQNVASGSRDSAVNVTFSGAGTFRKSGSGTLLWGATSATFNLGAGSLIDVQGGTFTGGSNANEVWTSNLSSLNIAAGATFAGVEAAVRVDALTGAGTLSSGYTASGSITIGVNNGSGTFSGVIQDTDTTTAKVVNLTKAGTGTETLSGANTFTGPTTLSAGTLNLSNSLALQNSILTITAGSTLVFDSSVATNAFSVGGLGGSVNLALLNSASAPVALTVGGSNASSTYGGVLSGTGSSLIKTGTGTFTLNAANTYTGATVVNGGILILGNAATFKNSSSVTVTAPGLLGIGQGSESGQFAAGVVIQGTGGITDEINNANTGITMDRANTYSGQTTWASRGIIFAGVASNYDGSGNQTSGAFGINSAIVFANNQGTLALGGKDNQVGSLSGLPGGGGGVQLRGATITIGGDNTSTTYTGAISNNYLQGTDNNGTGSTGQAPGGNVIKIGTGTQTIAATANPSSYEGTTTIKGGVLSINLLGTSGFVNTTATVATTTTVTVPSTTGLSVGMGVFDLTSAPSGTTITNITGNTITLSNALNGSVTGARANTDFGFGSGIGISGPAASNLVLDGGTLKYTGALTSTDRLFTVGSNEAGGVTGTLDASGAGALTFSNPGSVAYGTTGQARTLGLTGTSTAANTLAPLIADNGSGAVSLTKSGVGSWTLSGANSYTGGTTVNQGTLTVGTGGTLGAAAGALTVSNTNTTAAGTAAILNLATAVDTTTGSLSGAISTPTSGTNSATINTGGTGLNFTVNQTVAGTYAGVIAGAGNFALGSSSTNTLVLTGANPYTGTTTISAGTLQLGNGGVSGSLSGTTAISNNGMLVVNRNNPFLGSVDLHGAGITGSGGFSQIGSGTTTLDVANSFTGGTVISNGQVSASVSGSLGSGTSGTASVAIANTATLLLTGAGNLDRVRNDAAINLGGGTVAIASGASEGTAATVSGGTNSGTGSAVGLGALTLSANSTLNFDATGGSTLLVFNSFAAAGFTLNITGYTNSTYDGTANSGAATDDRLVFNSSLTSDQLAAINFGSGMVATEIDLGNGYFEVGQAIPEPASLVYLGAALLGLTGWRNRRMARR